MPVITLPLNSGEEFGVLKSDVDEWTGLYPATDVMQCLRNMRGWLLSNPLKRKTEKGIRRFITLWLQKEQDRGGTPGYVKASGDSGSFPWRNAEGEFIFAEDIMPDSVADPEAYGLWCKRMGELKGGLFL